MPRVLALLAALLVLPSLARAQEAKPQAQGAAPAAPAASAEADPKVQAAIQKAVDKAKEELRSEMRAELQGAQSAAEFMGTVAEQPKVELLQLDGYFRVRGETLNKLNLRNTPDTSGYNYFPKPLRASSTISDANMRLRLEPTINASETVRVRAQIDVLDNYVLGSSTSKVTDGTGSPYPVPFYGTTRTYVPGDKTNDRDLIIPRRVWGELQTPLGLLSFGRMPSSWGLGILANDGKGLDQDFGDTVDRIQFALTPVGTPIGDLIFIPMYDFDSTGPLFADPHGGAGMGQPLSADRGANARSLGLKVVRLESEEEIRRKLERGERSLNYGFYYTHRSQKYVYPAWLDTGFATTQPPGDPSGTPVFVPGSTTATFNRRGANAHVLSFWSRYLTSKLRIETELVGLYGTVGNANAGSTATELARAKLHMRQWGGVLQTEYKPSAKIALGLEVGAASGDGAPGFGNDPNRVAIAGATTGGSPNYGSIEGPQWGRPNDRSINNFRFNPAYRVDLMFYRRILGQITDSVYAKPSFRWNIMPGLVLDTSALYAQAQVASSTPSSRPTDPSTLQVDPAQKGKRPLALEIDNTLSLSPTRAFTGWVDLGFLKPLSGMDSGTSVAWMVDFGLAARF